MRRFGSGLRTPALPPAAALPARARTTSAWSWHSLLPRLADPVAAAPAVDGAGSGVRRHGGPRVRHSVWCSPGSAAGCGVRAPSPRVQRLHRASSWPRRGLGARACCGSARAGRTRSGAPSACPGRAAPPTSSACSRRDRRERGRADRARPAGRATLPVRGAPAAAVRPAGLAARPAAAVLVTGLAVAWSAGALPRNRDWPWTRRGPRRRHRNLPGVTRPTSFLRSGGPARWSPGTPSGRRGRAFVS